MALATALSQRSFKIAVWDDEGASQNSSSNAITYAVYSSSMELIANSDFIVVTRPLNDFPAFAIEMKNSKKPFIDLWRQS